MKIVAVHKYAGKAREMAKRIKNAADDEALQQAAQEMAPLVPKGAVLIPAPSSTGLNRSMVVLANYIASLTEGKVVEAIKRIHPVASSMMLRQAGKAAVSLEEHIASMELVIRPPQHVTKVVVIDNVVTSGNTLKAMEAHLGVEVQAVVYADASRYVRSRNPVRPVRICIAGSRKYKNLSKVHWIISHLPADAVIVHGGAQGVDERADAIARALGLQVEIFRPAWEKYGKAAGPIRNREMVYSCDALYAFWDGVSRGTASAIQAAVEFDKDLEVILDDER